MKDLKEVDKPLVSVLMTAYNREKYIAEAIESVMASTYKNWELIIVDDCSSDRTVELARSYEAKDDRIKVFINEKNLGDYPNRNRAASYAKGKYLKYLDSDDIIYPHGLDVFVYYMERYPEAALGMNWRFLQHEGKYPILLHPNESLDHHFNHRGLFHNAPGSVIIRKDAFDAVGGFSQSRHVGDFSCWLKLAARYPILKISFFPMWSRKHGDQENQKHRPRYRYSLSTITTITFLENELKRNSSFPILINRQLRIFKHRVWRNIFSIAIKDMALKSALKVYSEYRNRHENSYFSN